MKLGFIGLGNMAGAMIGGITAKGLVSAADIIGFDPGEEKKKQVREKFGITVANDNRAVTEQADIVVLAVKPQMYEGVIREIRDCIQASQIVISIAPGKTLEWLTGQFGRELKLVRCMPNTPALVGEGCTGVCRNAFVTEEEFAAVSALLNGFGKAYAVEEKQMDAVVAVSGSSPAYVFLLIEAMADAAVAEGLPRAKAYEFAAQAVYGSAKMVLETGRHPGELKDMVCSPGGTTIEAVAALEERGFRSAVIEAMRVCAEKSRTL
ncbi:MAG: pyrroline-5-carboxylate reductase [Lachnospiraceae bacterium]